MIKVKVRGPDWEPLWRVILRGIEEAGHPLTSTEMADFADVMPGMPSQRRQSRVNLVIAEAPKGLFVRAGKTPGAWQNPPKYLWDITDAGRDRLAQGWPPPPSASDVLRAETAARVAAKAWRYKDMLMEAGRRGWKPGVPVQVRQQAARELRDADHSLQEIGDIFGVTGECIRLDLKGRRD